MELENASLSLSLAFILPLFVNFLLLVEALKDSNDSFYKTDYTFHEVNFYWLSMHFCGSDFQ